MRSKQSSRLGKSTQCTDKVLKFIFNLNLIKYHHAYKQVLTIAYPCLELILKIYSYTILLKQLSCMWIVESCLNILDA